MYTTGSGAGVGDVAGTIATARRIVRPLALARFSGTTKKPQRAFCSAEIGSCVVGHAPDSNLGDAATTTAPLDAAAGALIGLTKSTAPANATATVPRTTQHTIWRSARLRGSRRRFRSTRNFRATPPITLQGRAETTARVGG